ncbi:hypothetical protein [Nocardia cyriacigeorgica]|uniref:hypothetical protein n=1 Tax=Nocardia cyriacigeorgica TaxID=135487 RepID=UPI0024560FFE|nr:hypothetical protein [Nocardia cyriacigeorgica]
MRTHDEIEKAARPGRPFSNGTEWETWQYNVCMGGGTDSRRCVLDDNDDCPLIAVSLNEVTPVEWEGLRGRYRCTEKTTPAQARAADAAAERAAIEAQHYPLFDADELRE